MSPSPIAKTPPAAGAALDAQLRAWFEALLAQPVPEALLRRLDEQGRLSPPPARTGGRR